MQLGLGGETAEHLAGVKVGDKILHGRAAEDHGQMHVVTRLADRFRGAESRRARAVVLVCHAVVRLGTRGVEVGVKAHVALDLFVGGRKVATRHKSLCLLQIVDVYFHDAVGEVFERFICAVIEGVGVHARLTGQDVGTAVLHAPLAAELEVGKCRSIVKGVAVDLGRVCGFDQRCVYVKVFVVRNRIGEGLDHEIVKARFADVQTVCDRGVGKQTEGAGGMQIGHARAYPEEHAVVVKIVSGGLDHLAAHRHL